MKATWLLPCASFLVSFLLTRWVISRAAAWRLVQAPNHRSSHDYPTPNGGGLGIVVASLAAGAWLEWGDNSGNTASILALSVPLAVVGLLDDMRPIPPAVRFLVQLLVVLAFLAIARNIPLPDHEPEPAPGVWLAAALLVFACLWWINLFNFMDGIDGIAGIQATFMLLASLALAAWAHPNALNDAIWTLAACLAAATLGFLVLNWPPARVFMGDVGSTWLAFTILAFALRSVQALWLSYATWAILAAVFVTDATVTLATRVLRGERWYQAHRSHAYQRLARRWHGQRKAGHRAVTVLVLVINICWLFPLAWVSLVWPHWSMVCLLAAYAPLATAAVLLGAGTPD